MKSDSGARNHRFVLQAVGEYLQAQLDGDGLVQTGK